ncbi:hypothetical protein FQR65_LT20909 [Abscondita terminalis]|nr:hypothetical protein FQR65_LT20909 [Abscondita terminalis]
MVSCVSAITAMTLNPASCDAEQQGRAVRLVKACSTVGCVVDECVDASRTCLKIGNTSSSRNCGHSVRSPTTCGPQFAGSNLNRKLFAHRWVKVSQSPTEWSEAGVDSVTLSCEVGRASLSSWTISIDTGGTFTDAVARSDKGEICEAKVASTPHDPSLGLRSAVAALEERGVELRDVSLVCHGTTVATNATLTGSLGRAALVTTEGFRDVLGYRQQQRPDVYSLTPRRPAELVPRDLRFEIEERLDSAGRVLKPVSRSGLLAIIEQLREAAPEAIAVSLLFSYLNDAHEREVGEALREAFPQTPIALSSELVREFREYPRTATTAINAALRPVVEDYLRRAGAALAASGVGSPLLVMQSNGGLDMGGTSTDVCLLRNSTIPFSTVQEVQDHTLLAPTVDIHTIGAGGGSIAWIDRTGSLKVGPVSAKAVPGPALGMDRGGRRSRRHYADLTLYLEPWEPSSGCEAVLIAWNGEEEPPEKRFSPSGSPIWFVPYARARGSSEGPDALPADAVVETRDVLLPGYGSMPTPVIERGALVAGVEFSGPAIIQQMDATSVILPGQLVQVASTLDLIVTERDREGNRDE